MLFTIGHTKSYLQYFEEQTTPLKKGKEGDYPGGSVWKTKEEAQYNCPAEYSVFGVLADWDKDTEPSLEGTWNSLLISSELVKLQ